MGTDRLLYSNLSAPAQGPQVSSAVFDAWDPSWADYHFGTGSNSYVCKPGSGFRCGGVRVQFDQELVLKSSYGDRNSYDNGLVLWDRSMKKSQPAQITSVDGDTLQLNTTWAWGEDAPAILQYAYTAYPTMRLYNAFELPTPQFTVNISVPDCEGSQEMSI